MRRTWILTKLLFCLCLFLMMVPHGCDGSHASATPLPSSGSSRDDAGPRQKVDVTAQPDRPKKPVSTERPRIVAFGNSLTAGLGVPRDQSYPAHLQRTLDAAGYAYQVVNAGVSGDTTAGGVRRVSWTLNQQASDRHSGTRRQRWAPRSQPARDESQPRTDHSTAPAGLSHRRLSGDETPSELWTGLYHWI